MSPAGSTSRAQQTHGEERPPLVQTLLSLELGETRQCPKTSWDLLPENGLRALFHSPGMCSTTPAASTHAAVPFKSPCQLLVSSRAELSVSHRRQQPDGFGTTILWSHWCLQSPFPLWKSLPQVRGRTRGLGLLCGCSVTHPRLSLLGRGCSISTVGFGSLCPTIPPKHPDRCQPSCLAVSHRHKASGTQEKVLRRTSTALLSPSLLCHQQRCSLQFPFPTG